MYIYISIFVNMYIHKYIYICLYILTPNIITPRAKRVVPLQPKDDTKLGLYETIIIHKLNREFQLPSPPKLLYLRITKRGMVTTSYE